MGNGKRRFSIQTASIPCLMSWQAILILIPRRHHIMFNTYNRAVKMRVPVISMAVVIHRFPHQDLIEWYV
jgi:hypothetical protein